MRVRITYTGQLDPCGGTTYGEVEDYTINLIGPNYWTGVFNHYWHKNANWSAGHIPTEDEDVYLTNAGYQPVYVDNYPGFTNEACYNLNIQAGGSLQVWDMTTQCQWRYEHQRSLSMTDATGVINIKGTGTIGSVQPDSLQDPAGLFSMEVPTTNIAPAKPSIFSKSTKLQEALSGLSNDIICGLCCL